MIQYDSTNILRFSNVLFSSFLSMGETEMRVEDRMDLKVEMKVGRKSKKSQRNLKNSQGKESGAAGDNFSYFTLSR